MHLPSSSHRSLRPFIPRLCELLLPSQVGIGTHLGCEAAYHLLFHRPTLQQKRSTWTWCQKCLQQLTLRQCSSRNSKTPPRNLPLHVGLLSFRNIPFSWKVQHRFCHQCATRRCFRTCHQWSNIPGQSWPKHLGSLTVDVLVERLRMVYLELAWR